MRAGVWAYPLCALHFATLASAHWRGKKGSWHDWSMPGFSEPDASGSPKWHRKLCKKMRHFSPGLADLSPGCNYADQDSEEKHHRGSSERHLHSKLRAEEDKSSRLREQLEKEKAGKLQELQAKDRQQRKLQQQVQLETSQNKHCKSKLQTKIRELEKDRAAKREKEHETRQERDQAMHLKSKLEAKVRKLEGDTVELKLQKEKAERQCAAGKACAATRTGKGTSNSSPRWERSGERWQTTKVDDCQLKLSEVEKHLENERAHSRHASEVLEMHLENERATQANYDALLQNVTSMASQLSTAKRWCYDNTEVPLYHALEVEKTARLGLLEILEAEQVKNALLSSKSDTTAASSEHFWPLSLGLAMLAVLWTGLLPSLMKTRQANNQLSINLNTKSLELAEQRAQLLGLQTEFNSELGAMMKADRHPRNLGTDFTYHIHDEKVDQGTVRSIKIQCPGVRHSEVFVEIIFNGCIVTVSRPASRGVDAAQWEQRFQFRPSEGMFEFKEDQATLDQGYLTVVFRSFAFQSRPFRFPKHFDLADTDIDGTWEYPQESAAGHVTETSMRGTAPGRLEMNAAAAAEFGDHASAVRMAETSGSPIGTDDYEAARDAVACVAMQQAASAHDSVDSPAPEEVSPEVTGEECGVVSTSPKALSSQAASEDFEKVQEEDVFPEEEGDYEA